MMRISKCVIGRRRLPPLPPRRSAIMVATASCWSATAFWTSLAASTRRIAPHSTLANGLTTYAIHKPRGVLSAFSDSDPEQHTLADVIATAGFRPLSGHIGRLDVQSSGLLLVTEDSALLQAVLHNDDHDDAIPKEYALLLSGRHLPASSLILSLAAPLTFQRRSRSVSADAAVVRHVRCFRDAELANDCSRIDIAGDAAAALWQHSSDAHTSQIVGADADADPGAAAGADGAGGGSDDGWLTEVRVEICQGRHHQIRRLCKRAGLRLLHLRRVAIGPIELGKMRAGEVRPLSEEEEERLYAACWPVVQRSRSRRAEAANVMGQRRERRALRQQWKMGRAAKAV